MATRADNELSTELTALLAARFEGVAVEVSHSERWNRPCVTFRWAGFAALLPEERYHRLIQVIPADVRTSRMAGLVWLELAPDETVEAFLTLPRSEDVADRESTIYDNLKNVGFFEALAASRNSTTNRKCQGDFSMSKEILSANNYSEAEMRDAKLVFIRHGVYCDCQVLETVCPALHHLDAGAM